MEVMIRMHVFAELERARDGWLAKKHKTVQFVAELSTA
jgi:hypothetical protein